MNQKIRSAVQQFFNPEVLSYAFGEAESYYARSSHSHFDDGRGRVWGYTTGLDYLDRPLNPLFEEAGQGDGGDATTVALCSEIEKFYIMGYMASAVYDEKDYENQKERWFHQPLSGAWTTFQDLWENDERVPRGVFLGLEDFKNDAMVATSYTKFGEVNEMRRVGTDAHGTFLDSDKRVAYQQELDVLQTLLLQTMGTIRERALALLQTIPDQAEVSATS